MCVSVDGARPHFRYMDVVKTAVQDNLMRYQSELSEVFTAAICASFPL